MRFFNFDCSIDVMMIITTIQDSFLLSLFNKSSAALVSLYPADPVYPVTNTQHWLHHHHKRIPNTLGPA